MVQTESAQRMVLSDVSNQTNRNPGHSVKASQLIKIVITGSGFHGAAREQLQQLAGSIGATYSADLVQGKTTHLVCRRLIDCFGTFKYQKALEWGVQIVTYDWLIASSAAGAAVPEQDYKDDPPQALQPSPAGVKLQPSKNTLLQDNTHLSASAPASSSDCQLPSQRPQEAVGRLNRDESQSARRASSLLDLPWEQQQRVQRCHAAVCTHNNSSRDGTISSGAIKVLQGSPVDLWLQDSPKLSGNVCWQPTTDDILLSTEAPADSVAQQQGCLSKHGKQQQQRRCPVELQQQCPSQLQQQHGDIVRSKWSTFMADGAANTDSSAASSGSFNFQQHGHTSQQASPCIENFLQLQGHQQQDHSPCRLSSSPAAAHPMTAVLQEWDPQHDREMQRRPGSADVQCNCASQQQMERQQVCHPVLTNLPDGQDALPTSPANLADVATQPQDNAAAGAPAPGGQTGAANQTPGMPSTLKNQFELAEVLPVHQNSGAVLLLIPETQAEPNDLTWAAAELPQTPMSLKHYASQQPRVHQALAAEKQQQTKKDRPEQSAAGLVPDDPAWCNQQQVADAQQQQQQQHDAKEVVQTHSLGSYSRLTASSGGHSTELVRLRRRDGCRRQGRILVSELPDHSQWELEDSDCEVYSHDGNGIATLRKSVQSGCSLTSPAAAAAPGTALPSAMASSFRPHNQGPDHVMNSPVHSCSGSSLPAHSHGGDELVVAGPLMSPGAQVVAECDAASVVVAMAGRPTSASSAALSDGGSTAGDRAMPVMRLQFNVQQSQQQQYSHGSQHTDNSARVCDPDWSGESSSNTYDDSSSSSSNEGSSTVASGGGSRGNRLQLQGRKQRMETIAGTAAAIREKRQLLKQQQQQQQQQHPVVSAGQRQDQQLSAEALPAASLSVTYRRPDLQGRSAASEAVAEAFPASGTTVSRLAVPHVQQESKLELAEHAAQQLVQVPSAAELPGIARGAEALLQHLQHRQQQHNGQDVCKLLPQQQQQHQDLPQTPAEAMLHHLQQKQLQKSQQQQQQQQQQEEVPAVADPCAAEDIDDCLPLAAAAAASAASRRCAPARLSTGSVSSFATDMTSVSRKVPLNLGTSGLRLPLTDTTDGSSPLEKVLQNALRLAESSAAAGPVHLDQQMQQQGLLAVRPHSTSPLAHEALPANASDSCWLHTPEEQQRQLQHQAAAQQQQPLAAGGSLGSNVHHLRQTSDSDDDAFELTEVPTRQLAARDKVMSRHLGARLAHLSQADGAEQVVPLKLLSKAPRGSTAKAAHGLKSSSKLSYAEQVQVPWAHVTFGTKEKSKCMIVLEPTSFATSTSTATGSIKSASSHCTVQGQQQQQQASKVFLAEPLAFYQLPSGEWWVELLRFFSAKDLRGLAKAAEAKLHLPADFQIDFELLRGMTHEHVSMRQVQGEFKLSKVRKAPGGARSRVNPFFWRFSFDTSSCQVLTDRPVTDYVMQ